MFCPEKKNGCSRSRWYLLFESMALFPALFNQFNGLIYISTILNANKCLYLCLYITQEQSTILYVLSDGPKEEKFYERVS